MPRPIAGLVPIVEFGSKVEADIYVAVLRDHGIEAMASHDPALGSVAPYHATERVVEVLVRAEDAEAAVAVLEALDVEDPPAGFRGVDDEPVRRPMVSRPALRTAIGLILVVALVAPILLSVVLALTAR